MQPEIIAIAVFVIFVLALFMAFRRKAAKISRAPVANSGTDLRNDPDNRRYSSAMSSFKTLLLTIVSLALGFALVGFCIETFIEPEFGPMDPWDIPTIVGYLAAALVIYRILRLFIRN